MQFRTRVDIAKAAWEIMPGERMLLVGSCFANEIGRRLREEHFGVVVNPYGVMYNPASVRHTVERAVADAADEPPRIVVLTLGTNHVYILNATGEIVDNCRKQPQRLFTERELAVDECLHHLAATVDLLRQRREDVKVIITVSPIRYAKYGYHGSRLSKAVLLLAADRLATDYASTVTYFPAYEIVCDELRDYRFYAADMLHPSETAVEYVYERFAATFFAETTRQFVAEWEPLRKALAHRPLDADSAEYKAFAAQTRQRVADIEKRYNILQS